MIDRRAFISLLVGSAAAEAIDIERLLWVPKPIITVPAMPSLLTTGTLHVLRDYSSEFAAMVNHHQRMFNHYIGKLIEAKTTLAPRSPWMVNGR